MGRTGSLVAVAAVAALAGCGEPPDAPEQALRDWVARAEAAAEARDTGDLVDLLSPDYADARGNGLDDVERMLRWWFLRHDSVALLVDIAGIEVIADTAARIELTAGMAGTNDRLFGFSADAYRFELTLERRDGDWQLIAARWGEVGGELR